jgi:hypothetical protein
MSKYYVGAPGSATDDKSDYDLKDYPIYLEKEDYQGMDLPSNLDVVANSNVHTNQNLRLKASDIDDNAGDFNLTLN